MGIVDRRYVPGMATLRKARWNLMHIKDRRKRCSSVGCSVKDEIREKKCRTMESERNAERHYYADNNRTKVQESGLLKDMRAASILYSVGTDSGQWK